MKTVRIGCAGWSLGSAHKAHFPAEGTQLERYAAVFNAVEINSSFYRPHRPETYRRWSASVPGDFRFAAKLPRSITHEHRLAGTTALLDKFLAEVGALGASLGVLLIQLPPSLAYAEDRAGAFLRTLRERHAGGLCLEPRHASWFSAAAESLLDEYRVARVGADPALNAAAAVPGGGAGPRYTRLHGSPRMYWSDYGPEQLQAVARRLRAEQAAGADSWCIFDNTAAGHALGNALELRRLLRTAAAGGDPS
ncbi:DUF72 domain-containing protein [Tahibacter harae]|uniref:DUF72 domain-containing protein n=1 Tax=Tahibacter harae TaxID=2963937 RepID=A0ABT1QL60_9GAMM|nr:DUF72 domain-containing protein [Tahibacter harae]MCQ4163269.1 DUF72 domain-containing protein [Tahibacter harae]